MPEPAADVCAAFCASELAYSCSTPGPRVVPAAMPANRSIIAACCAPTAEESEKFAFAPAYVAIAPTFAEPGRYAPGFILVPAACGDVREPIAAMSPRRREVNALESRSS